MLVRFDDAWQLGFEVERLENGLVAVFIPGAPQANSGEVYWLSPDRVSPVEAPPAAALKSLKRLGAGSNALLRTSIALRKMILDHRLLITEH